MLLINCKRWHERALARELDNGTKYLCRKPMREAPGAELSQPFTLDVSSRCISKAGYLLEAMTGVIWLANSNTRDNSLIFVGILVSYLPQHYRIIARGTSEGISPYFILLGTTSGTSAFANILVLPASRADVACCKTVSTFECFAGLLGIAQVGMQWFCFAIM